MAMLNAVAMKSGKDDANIIYKRMKEDDKIKDLKTIKEATHIFNELKGNRFMFGRPKNNGTTGNPNNNKFDTLGSGIYLYTMKDSIHGHLDQHHFVAID